MPSRHQPDADARRDADIANLDRQVETLAAGFEELRLAVTTALQDPWMHITREHVHHGGGRHHRHPSPEIHHHDFGKDDGSDTASNVNPFAPLAHGPDFHGDESRRWESGFKLEIPEFTGGLDPSEFLDWINAVEVLLSFKDVPDHHRVPLVATHFWGRASSWWQQVKLTRQRQGKPRLSSWVKFHKYLEREFLPFNYDSSLYQRLHSLRQNSRSVDAYTEEFYQLLSRVDIRDSPAQLMSRYIGGLKLSYQDTLNLFAPIYVSEANQRALLLEQQATRRPILTSATPRASNVAPSSSVPTAHRQPPLVVSGTDRCFNCGESGHKRANCPHPRNQRALLADEDILVPDPPRFDVDPNIVLPEEHVTGDVGPLLVLRRSCLAPRETEIDP